MCLSTPNSPVKLPNLNVALFDKLASMLQRGGVIGRHEVIAPNDLARAAIPNAR